MHHTRSYGYGSVATMEDVAIDAGLSIRTVRSYLEGKLELPAQTARRIESAVQGLGFGQGLGPRSGLAIPEVGSTYFGTLADAFLTSSTEARCDVVLHLTRGRLIEELRQIERLRSGEFDGLALHTSNPRSERLQRAVAGLAGLVVLGEPVLGIPAHSVRPDNLLGGRPAARSLVASGHRKFCYVAGPTDCFSVRERGHGFIHELRAQGLPRRCLRVEYGSHSQAHGFQTTMNLFAENNPPTGIFAGSDRIGEGVIRAARTMGRRIPEDFISFGDFGFADLMEPPLTAIRVSIDEIARRSVHLLARGARTPSHYRGIRQIVPVEMVARGSVAAPRLAGPVVPQHQSTRFGGRGYD